MFMQPEFLNFCIPTIYSDLTDTKDRKLLVKFLVELNLQMSTKYVVSSGKNK